MLALLIAISDAVYLALNGLLGGSILVDALVALPMDNPLVKAGPVGACFVYAWHCGGDDSDRLRRRKLLLATLAAMAATVVATKALSGDIVHPRPFVLSQQVYHLEGEQLVESPRLDYRVPLTGPTRGRYEGMTRGDVNAADFGSFPSDHAGFYVALALGIFLASRMAGALALAWTAVAILGTRIATGMHSPLDIAAGAAIGAAALAIVQLAAARWGARPLRFAAGLANRYPGLGAALLFLIMFEVVSTLENLRDAAGAALAVVGA